AGPYPRDTRGPGACFPAGCHRHLARIGGGPAQGDRGRSRRVHGETELQPARPARDRRAARRPVTGVPRVLICEPSRSFALRLLRLLEDDGDITVAAVCATAEEAIAALPRVRPDVMTMDIELPGMDGLAAIQGVMRGRPLPTLVIPVDAANGNEKAAAALADVARDTPPRHDHTPGY